MVCSHSAVWIQGETVALADVYGLVAGGAAAAAVLFRKQVQYRQQYGIGEFFRHIRIAKR
jgi:2-phospho-L-lactate guanylyltransferase (CobY/MobA/RfbA family)